MSHQASSASVDNLTLALAYQAQDFFESEHSWIYEISASQKLTIAQYLQTTVQSGQSDQSDHQTQSKLKGAIIWSEKWVTGLSKLKQDIDHIVQFIQASFAESFISELNKTESLSYTWMFYKPPQTLSSEGAEKEAQAAMTDNERAGQKEQEREDQSFIRAQQQKLTELIAQTLAAQKSAACEQSSAKPWEEQGSSSESEGVNEHITFQAKDIDYFDPQVNATEKVIVKDWNIIYWNIFSFTNWVWVKAITVEPSLVCQNLNFCLLDQADKWYTEELSHIQWLGLHLNINEAEEWCKVLELHFWDLSDRSLTMLEMTHYTVKDT